MNQYNEIEKSEIVRKFSERYNINPERMREHLENCEWNINHADAPLRTEQYKPKTKTEQPKKPERNPIEKKPNKRTSRELAKEAVKRLHRRDNYASQHKFGNSTHLLETALNQFPNSPEIQRQIYKLLDQPKNTPIPHKKRKRRIF